MPRLRARWVLTSLVLLLFAFGCSSTSRVADSAPPLPDTDQERVVYVALGGNETLNRQLDDPLREAWTQRVFTTALPRSAVYVNFADRDATVRDGLAQQVPRALELQPTVATLWFGDGDNAARTSDASFERDLSQMTEQLQAAGTNVLLLARVDPSGDGETDLANVVERVALATGATFVSVPVGEPRESATQAAIAAAVTAGLGP